MSVTPEVVFHGAAHTVTGSCMELRLGDDAILIDCGLFQGSRTLEALNREPFAFDVKAIRAVVLTHAHIDHSGLLPRLVAEGFEGKIWCTAATGDLLEHMLPDSGRIQEGEAERRNRRADRADEDPFKPIYTEEDANLACAQVQRVMLCAWFEPVPGFRVRLWNAGHILGSASAEVEIGGTHLLFSGDLGPDQKAFHPDPSAPVGVDHVFCESTYGDRARVHVTMEERRALLQAEINEALGQGGNLVIPVFALERTQELLLDIARLIDTGRINQPQVFIDSPLASRATKVFEKYVPELEDVGGKDIFRHPAFHYVDSVAESIRLNDVSGAIILAASGMCEAGRIRHHLLHNLGKRESTVLFVGFQAAGTLGRVILEGAKRVRLSGRDLAVRARIRRIDSYSAHADRNDVIAWIAARQPIGGSLFLSHGEAEASLALQQAVGGKDGLPSVIIPEIGERYALPPAAPAQRLATGRADLMQAVETDWQNDYAALVSSMKHELRQLENDRARREAVQRMRAVLESYNAHRENHANHRSNGH